MDSSIVSVRMGAKQKQTIIRKLLCGCHTLHKRNEQNAFKAFRKEVESAEFPLSLFKSKIITIKYMEPDWRFQGNISRTGGYRRSDFPWGSTWKRAWMRIKVFDSSADIVCQLFNRVSERLNISSQL